MLAEKKKIIYYISFEPDQDILLKGTKPTILLKELSELGEILIIPNTDKVPLIDDYNHEKIYLSWEIILSTDKDENTIKDVFIFVEDDCKLNVKQIDKGELKGDIEFFKAQIKNGFSSEKKEIKP